MASTIIEYTALPGTGASVGRAGHHTLIADRPEGKAGGTGLGFNGGELLALSLGGCFCNDVHYVAEELGVAVSYLQVEVQIELSGDPLLVTSARVSVQCELSNQGSTDLLLETARQRCTVANSLRNGVEVAFT